MQAMRIGLLWHQFGRPNLGVDALSRSNIAIVRAAAASLGIKPNFVLFGKPGDDFDLDDDIEIGPFLRVREILTFRSRRYRGALADCDLLIDICAGDGFTSIYGRFLFILHAFTKYLGLRSGRPFIFAPQTIGPFESAWTRATARYLFNNAVMTFSRDSWSTDAFKELGVRTPVEEVIDVAFRLPYDHGEGSKCGGVTAVGINISGLLARHGDRFGLNFDYLELNKRLVAHFSDKPNVQVYLVSHVHHDPRDSEDDMSVILEMASDFPNVRVSPEFQNAVSAKSFISQLDFFVGGRMHACIGAYSSLVPVVPIAYSRKFNGLFATLGYEHVVDGRSASMDEAFKTILSAFEDRDFLRSKIEQGMLSVARPRIARYQDFMSSLLRDVGGLSQTGTT